MLYDLNHYYSFIKATGSDAKTFLQGQLSCDLEKITHQHSSLSVICDPKGRIQALFRLLKINDDYFLRLPKDTLEHALLHLKKYAIFSKVDLTPSDDEIFIYGCMNEQAPQHLLSLTPFTGATEFYTNEPQDHAQSDISTWRKAQIETGIPEIHPETIGQFTPHNLNLQCIDETLSFNKGCYTGQEIVARMHYRGQLKQHMYLATLDSNKSISAYAAVVNEGGKNLGYVVDSVSSENKSYLLISIKDSALTENLSIDGIKISVSTTTLFS